MRISPHYLPGCGDRGVSNLGCTTIEKGDYLNSFFTALEDLESSLNEIKIAKPQFQQSEVDPLLAWLEEAVLAMGSFYYHLIKGRINSLSKFNFSYNSRTFIESSVRSLQPIYGGSKEFQIFDTHPNLFYLNTIRKDIRKVEHLLNSALKDERVQERIDISGQSADVTTFQSVINRLSSLLWVITLKEQSELDIEPHFWCSRMPEIMDYLEKDAFN